MNVVAIIISSAVVIAVAALAYLGYRVVRRRQRNGAKQLTRTLQPHAAWWNEHRNSDGELLYVAIGDSAAQGIGASRPHRSYVGQIAKHLRHVTGKSVRVINLSVSGARLREALSAQIPELPTLTPDVLTVAIGANDIASFDRQRFDAELHELFDALPPNAIVADVPCFFFGEAEKRVRIANRILRQSAAEHGFAVAPLYAKTRRQGAARVALGQVAADYFHPNDRGYRVWASAFFPLVDSRVTEHAHSV